MSAENGYYIPFLPSKKDGKAKGLSAHSGFTISSLQDTELEFWIAKL
jgi:hypothetical protein